MEYLNSIKTYVPTISEEFRTNCEKPILKCKFVEALKQMKTGKAPGIDGLTTEFFLCFWSIIEDPLMEMYRECIDKKEMSTTMKQGIISLIPKPNKDPLSIENWRPITLLNVDYKLFALVFARRLKRNLAEIINETQTGFMANRHISNNIRLVLDLLDYSEYVESQALIVFLDFYKAFDTVEHLFIYKALDLFSFGESFISVVKMLYKDINSNVLIYPNTSKRFPVNRSVRQGCPISPFLFLIVVELLSLKVLNSPNIHGLSIFQKEIRITQLADDTALFMRDKYQIGPTIQLINEFSKASGLHLNIGKCEILSLFDTDDEYICNIPLKKSVKYLGIDVTKDMLTRQQLNFPPRLKKTKTIMNMWLQRDLSIFGRILLTKAEGISRLVYPALSLYVQDSTSKEINNILTNFAWKNRHHYLKKDILSGPRNEGGFDLLHFFELNNTFKIKWIKECLRASDSIWYFIPNNIFKQLGGLHFLLTCNYKTTKLPIKLSKCIQQALLAWKLCYTHNFSPHKTIIWNNVNITVGKKSIFKQKWFDRGILYVNDLFDTNGLLLSYDRFLLIKSFPVTSKEFNSVIKAIPNGLSHLLKSHLQFQEALRIEPLLFVNGIDIMDIKCNNKHIRNTLFEKRKISPRGKAFWNSIFNDIDWQRAWLLPYKFCITNKMEQFHIKILHNIRICNKFVFIYIFRY